MSNIPSDQLPTPRRPGDAAAPPWPPAPPPAAPPPPAPGYQAPGYQAPGYQAPGYQAPGYQAAGYQPGGYPPVAPGGPAGGKQRRNAIIGAGVVVLIAATVGIVLATRSDDSPTTRPRTDETDDPSETDETDDTPAPGGDGGGSADLTAVFTTLWGIAPAADSVTCLSSSTAGLEADIATLAAGGSLEVNRLQAALVPFVSCAPTDVVTNTLSPGVAQLFAGNADQQCISSIWLSLPVDTIATELAVAFTDNATYQTWATSTFGSCAY